MLKLADLKPLVTGNVRAIYQHPLHADLLIKIVRAEAIARRWDAPGRWLKRLPRVRHYSGFLRELKEYIAIQARSPHGAAPIARMTGIVETDLGLGLVCEKVVAPDGAMAPSLHSIYLSNGGATAATDMALEQLLAELLRYNVIVGDLHPGNIAYGSDSRGGPHLILVDGFGEKHVVPRNSMSRWLNRHNTRRLFRRLRKDLSRPTSSWGPPLRDP